MIELTLSVLAWVGVVLVQAIIHYSVIGARRRIEDDDGLLLSDAEEEQSELKGGGLPQTVNEATVDAHKTNENEEAFDGDEPQMFFQLLEQTGSEMMNVSIDNVEWWFGVSQFYSLSFSHWNCYRIPIIQSRIENLVHEQMIKVDAVA